EGVGTYVISINDHEYHGETMINNASCTTNCITPVAKVIHEKFGIEKAMMTTIHAYTSDQELQDGGHKDYRRARAASQNIIPTSTGASIAAGEAFAPLKGIFGGLSIRVPVPVGSLADFTFLLKREVTKEEVNDVLRQASEEPVYKGVIAVTEDPVVSSDIIGNSHSSIVDLSLTQVVGGTMLKVIAWYDNEYGYANRLVEQVAMVGEKQSDGASSSEAAPVDLRQSPNVFGNQTDSPRDTTPQDTASFDNIKSQLNALQAEQQQYPHHVPFSEESIEPAPMEPEPAPLAPVSGRNDSTQR
ncbi:MAG TPA: hypothetical protein VLF20_01085, partial [Patescibacteria group bacterium]|nr:hypothetical protein [Patescibacteria group bacterium]